MKTYSQDNLIEKGKDKKKWKRPTLIIISSGTPAEFVLNSCGQHPTPNSMASLS